MLNDLTPAEQRAWIEDVLRPVEKATRHSGPVAINRNLFLLMARLALAALPKIEWREGKESRLAVIPGWTLIALQSGMWSVETDDDAVIETGRAPTLEAAQAAAEAALLKKLIGGGE